MDFRSSKIEIGTFLKKNLPPPPIREFFLNFSVFFMMVPLMWLIFANLVNELDFNDIILSHWMIWYGKFGLVILVCKFQF